MSGSAWRDRCLEQLDTEWDAVVVGGGITGAGILRLAAGRGWRVLLLEQRDFAWGASSRSGKLVHGGLRYLAQGRVGLTRQSVRERERLMREAPGLVRPRTFLLPLYRGQGDLLYRMGLWLYDLLAGRRSRRQVGVEGALALAPCLDRPDLAGGFTYRDAATDDARLVLRLILAAVRDGGFALNYAPVTGLLTGADGRVTGVAFTDEVSGASFTVYARVVINAAGAWSDRLRAGIGQRPVLRPLRGSHLVFPASRLPLAHGVNLLHPSDGRPLYVFPWEGVTLVGTTDLDHREDLQGEPLVTPAEREYLLAAVQAFFPSLGLGERDVQAAFAGVRPVVGTGCPDPSREPRDMFLAEEKNLVTATGGKLTTFRLLAAKALVLAGRKASLNISSPDRQRVLAEAEAGGGEPIPATPYYWDEVAGKAGELVVHLDDLLLRRLRLGLVLPGDWWLERVGEMVRPVLGWDGGRWLREKERYLDIVARAYR